MSNTIVITDNEANVIEVVTEGPRGPAGLSGLLIYTTASDVASVTLAVGEPFRTAGYYVAGDGGGALYHVSATKEKEGDLPMADGKWAILHQTEVGRVYLPHYGVMASQADNQIKFQSAINDAILLSGGAKLNSEKSASVTILGRDEMFYIGSEVTVAAGTKGLTFSGIKVAAGDGYVGTQLINIAGGTGNDACRDIELLFSELDGRLLTSCLYVGYTNTLRVENNQIHHFTEFGVRKENAGVEGIFVQNMIYQYKYGEANFTNATGIGIDLIDRCTDNKFNGNVIYLTGTGVRLNSSCSSNLLVANHIYGCTELGILIDVGRTIIVGNQFDHNGLHDKVGSDLIIENNLYNYGGTIWGDRTFLKLSPQSSNAFYSGIVKGNVLNHRVGVNTVTFIEYDTANGTYAPSGTKGQIRDNRINDSAAANPVINQWSTQVTAKQFISDASDATFDFAEVLVPWAAIQNYTYSLRIDSDDKAVVSSVSDEDPNNFTVTLYNPLQTDGSTKNATCTVFVTASVELNSGS